MEVLQAALEDIDQLVVSIGIGRPKKETLLEHEIPGIADDSFDHFAVVEVDAYPQARHDGCMFVEVESSVSQIAIEGLDEEDRLRVLGGDVLHDI
jgi:hypothetical protein